MTRAPRLAILFLLFGLTACSHLPRMESTHDVLTPAEHLTLGDVYLSKGERKPARQQYEMALDADRRSIPALAALGNMAFEDKDLKTARRYFSRAQSADPSNPVAVNNLAMVDVLERVHLKRARECIERVLPAAGATAPYMLDTLASIAILEGRMADAKRLLDQAEAAPPANDPNFRQHIQETREKLPASVP